MYRDVKREVESTQHRLLEELAWQLIGMLLGGYGGRVQEVWVRVRKPHVAVEGAVDFLGVEMTRTRREWEEDVRRIKSRRRPKDITQVTVE